ncbi:uncharacterized protein [Tenebrio molitor]|uniref:uncharacterized protein n=1 Tax=Tenebrio molitor TaxID=7067 RepID=UPI0036247E7D
MCDQEISEWVQIAVKNENFTEFEIEVHGETKKDDGYVGTIVFVTVIGTTTTGHQKCLNLAIKAPKSSKTLREQMPIDKFFEKEIHIYAQVVASFGAFLQEEKCKFLLDFLPECYAMRKTRYKELIILENLKTKGYVMCDRKVPMTFDHVKLVLQTFGKWHALSLALKTKRPKVFEELVADNVNMFCYYITTANMVDTVFDYTEEVKIASNLSEVEQLKFSRDDIRNIFSNLLFEHPEDHVILHGDGWTNNLMFKYDDTKIPSHVYLVDWQCSGLASPVMDLSHFVYACNDTKNHKDVNELLKIYHRSLDTCLRELGCDSRALFPYEKLVEHWKKFSCYGLFLGNFILKFSLCDAEEAPDFATAAEQGKEYLENFDFIIKNKDQYYERVKSNLLHYVQNLMSL